MTSFSIQSFGCRVNQAEAFAWANAFQKHGLTYEEDSLHSDLILLNTCTLTSRADSDVRSFIRKVSRHNSKARMIVTGCFVEQSADELKNNPQIWKIFPNQQKQDLASCVLSLPVTFEKKSIRPYRSRALVKIQDGCNFGCTFCIIPLVREKSISIEKERILNQVQEYIKQGFQEIVLTGVHLCFYGKDLNPQYSLLELLQEIEQLDDLGRIRLSSLDPRFLNRPLLEHMTKSPKICPHFHLSLQHGSDRILHLMGRRISQIDYEKILDYLHKESTQASLGADIIVGFPGESEEDFEKTYNFLELAPLNYFHVFSYSPRPETPAANWPQIDNKMKIQRSALLRNLSKKKSLDFRRCFIGKECEAIVIKKNDKKAQVLTSNYLNVSVQDCPAEEKDMVIVRITEVIDKESIGMVVSTLKKESKPPSVIKEKLF